MEENTGFIAQTARDYDMTFEQVKNIHSKAYRNDAEGKNFYPMLEEFIRVRADRANKGLD